MLRILGMMLAVGACVLPATPAFAGLTSLTPGATVPTTGGTVATDLDLPSYSVVYSTSYSVTNGPVSATIQADIVKVGTAYDFLFQVTNTSTATSIDGLTVQNYTNFTTSVDYLTNGSAVTNGNFVDGTVGSSNANRTSDGSAVGFNFDVAGPPITALPVGATSRVLVVATNAPGADFLGTAVASATTSGNGSAAASFVIEPGLNAIPEPGSLVLGSLALISGAGVYGFRRLRRD
jgi:hypothetical protein